MGKKGCDETWAGCREAQMHLAFLKSANSL